MAAGQIQTSLLTATNCFGHVHLVIGTNSLAGKRCEQSLSVGARPLLIAPATAAANIHYGLQKRIDTGEVTWLEKDFEDNDVLSLGREDVSGVVDAVFVTFSPRDKSAQHISALCKRNRVPVNVVDAPNLSSFSLLSTHTDGPLQIGVTTNGRGCHLASRIRREVAAALPSGLGSACARLGDVRRRIQQEDHHAHGALHGTVDADDADDTLDQSATFNKLVTEEDLDAAKNRRMRWLAQVCEYWPLKRLAAINDTDVENILKSYSSTSNHTQPSGIPPSTPAAQPKTGRLILAGSGPGHPDMLTRAAHKAIQAADLILADKLVPSGVLDLIPRRTPVSIARKFPGNAEQAQTELFEAAIAGVRAGKLVLRLKQGDPFLYGRGGEEIAYFRQHGLGDRVDVLPGITSALSAPLFCGIPVTQRDVSDQVLICTGTGKKGKPPAPPEYVASRTGVFLMALHRIGDLVRELTEYTNEEEDGGVVGSGDGMTVPSRKLWPKRTPCAVIERASCPDQRVIRTTLGSVAEAIEQEGSRPPGLLVVGKACEALYTPERGRSWVVEEGFRGADLDSILPGGGLEALAQTA